MNVTEINGAVDVLYDDCRIWCPPAFVARQRGLPFKTTEMTVSRPYWTSGVMCKHQACGPELTDRDIATLLSEVPEIAGRNEPTT